MAANNIQMVDEVIDVGVLATNTLVVGTLQTQTHVTGTFNDETLAGEHI